MKTPRTLTAALMCAGLVAGSPGAATADPEVDRILRQFEHEPSVREVQVAAINYYNVSPDKIRSLRSRTRTKALVPGISLGVTNTISTYSLAVDDIVFRNRGIAVFEDQSADFIGMTAAAHWNLERLVFNAEELDVLSLIGIQDGIQREVTALYYVRRRLQIELLLTPPATLEARLSARLRLEELTGLLDAYTGGFFSRSITERRSGPASIGETIRAPDLAGAGPRPRSLTTR